jgi:hypothetical protein
MGPCRGRNQAWIAKDKGFEADGLSGDLNNFVGMEQWTATAADCLDINDMGNIANINTDYLNSKTLARTSILTPNRLTGRNKIVCFFFDFLDGGLRHD